MPIFLGKLLPTGLLGLICAAMIAAFMSTHDSYLLVWSSVIVQDIIAPIKGDIPTKQRIKLTRIFIVIIGIYILVWGIFYKGSNAVWDYLSITGAIYFTGAISVLIGGLYFKWVSSAGAMAALLSGFTALIGLEPLQKLLLGYTIPSSEVAVVGLSSVSFSFIMMILFSFIFPDNKSKPKSIEEKKSEDEV